MGAEKSFFHTKSVTFWTLTARLNLLQLFFETNFYIPFFSFHIHILQSLNLHKQWFKKVLDLGFRDNFRGQKTF